MQNSSGPAHTRHTPARLGSRLTIDRRARLMQIDDSIREGKRRGDTRDEIVLRLMRDGWFETVEDARQHLDSYEQIVAEQHSRIVTRARHVAIREAGAIVLGLALIALVLLAGVFGKASIGPDLVITGLFLSLAALYRLLRLYLARKDELKLEKLSAPSENASSGWDGPENLREIQSLSVAQASEASREAQDAGIRPM